MEFWGHPGTSLAGLSIDWVRFRGPRLKLLSLPDGDLGGTALDPTGPWPDLTCMLMVSIFATGAGPRPPVEVSLMGGTGGCMLGGSEDDLCRPTRSKEPGFQLLDAED